MLAWMLFLASVMTFQMVFQMFFSSSFRCKSFRWRNHSIWFVWAWTKKSTLKCAMNVNFAVDYTYVLLTHCPFSWFQRLTIFHLDSLYRHLISTWIWYWAMLRKPSLQSKSMKKHTRKSTRPQSEQFQCYSCVETVLYLCHHQCASAKYVYENKTKQKPHQLMPICENKIKFNLNPYVYAFANWSIVYVYWFFASCGCHKATCI